jgi:hypothetical protein
VDGGGGALVMLMHIRLGFDHYETRTGPCRNIFSQNDFELLNCAWEKKTDNLPK